MIAVFSILPYGGLSRIHVVMDIHRPVFRLSFVRALSPPTVLQKNPFSGGTMKQVQTNHDTVETIKPLLSNYEAIVFGADRITVDPTPRDSNGDVEKDASRLDILLFDVELDIRREYGSVKRFSIGVQFVDELIGFENARDLMEKIMNNFDISELCGLNMLYTFEKKYFIYRFLREEYM